MKSRPALSPEQRAMVEGALAAQGFMRLVGAELEALWAGGCALRVARRSELLQQDGLFHGGVTAFLVDNATTAAAATLLREGQRCLTAEYKLNLLAPATGDTLVCTAEVIRAGRRMSVAEARVEAGERQAAVALATIAIID